MKLLPLVVALGVAACAGTEDDDDPGTIECPTHDQATFELGTGQSDYQPITEEQRLQISPGAQGGCHFFVSLITDGLAERGLKLQYTVFDADTGASTGSASTLTVRLRAAPGMPGKCQNLGATAFLIQPWKIEDKRVRLEVRLTDNEGRTATQSKTVIADWPDELGQDACGPRT